jgi:manganese transport protein
MSSFDQKVLLQAEVALRSKKTGWKQLLPFLGPAFIACVAYIDPGNFATNISGGAQYGYLLLWVVLGANLSAMFIQYLSAKLGVVTGKNLPELIRAQTSRPVSFFYWIQAEVMAMATDLAEFLGGALAFHLLLGIPMLWGAVLTGVVSFGLLGLQKYGFRPLEAAITVLVAVVTVCYVFEFFVSKPDSTIWAGLIPGFKDTNMLYLGIGILGATVMPHVIYLHSSLTQNRIPTGTPVEKKRLLFFTKIEVSIALGLAGIINMAMLSAAAAVFFGKNTNNSGDLTVAYQTLAPILGPFAAVTFAVALLASGLSSSTVGTMAGQVVMQGFVGFRIPLLVRRALTMIPAFVVIALGVDATQTLVFSQVVLSFGIPLAMIPLVLYTSQRKIMGDFVSKPWVSAIGWINAGAIVVLNLVLIYQAIFPPPGS